MTKKLGKWKSESLIRNATWRNWVGVSTVVKKVEDFKRGEKGRYLYEPGKPSNVKVYRCEGTGNETGTFILFVNEDGYPCWLNRNDILEVLED